MNTFGAHLRELREAKGLNQRQLADIAGLQPATISHLEQGVREVRMVHAIKLARVFDITVDELIAPVRELA
jgi:transcriptional regulator with XRE-family HTH domain